MSSEEFREAELQRYRDSALIAAQLAATQQEQLRIAGERIKALELENAQFRQLQSRSYQQKAARIQGNFSTLDKRFNSGYRKAA